MNINNHLKEINKLIKYGEKLGEWDYRVPKIKKHIFTGDDVNHPFDAICAENVVEYIMKKVPNHNIEDELTLEA